MGTDPNMKTYVVPPPSQMADPGSDSGDLRLYKVWKGSNLHDCVGSALAAMGPEKFLSIIPLNFEAEDLSQANVWIIPILKQHTVGGSLKFYAEQLFDMAEQLKQRSSQLKSEGRVNSTRNADSLVYSLWSLLPSFGNYPLDTAESFVEFLKAPLCNALVEEPDMRGIICSALRILIQQNNAILSNVINDDEEDMPTRRAMANYTTLASKNIMALKSSARDMLSVLPDVFMKSSKDCGGCLLDSSIETITSDDSLKSLYSSTAKRSIMEHMLLQSRYCVFSYVWAARHPSTP